jgi:hypothetical protein
MPVDGLHSQGSGGSVLAGFAAGSIYREQRFGAGTRRGALRLTCVHRVGRRESSQNQAVRTRSGQAAVLPC